MSDQISVHFQLIHPLAKVPAYQSALAAGADLQACLDTSLSILPGQRCLVPTGLIIALPAGYEGQIRPRSGLALKYGITCLNSPGTIDADYRGEVKVLLVNLGSEVFTVNPGDRIAQLVMAAVSVAKFLASEELADTGRSSGGFGSTGQ
ncbi:MAG: deoxyuridine 5'-triphosphate nucleotidohydrolase [Spirochaetes bacterium GWD1_61_31]|nr:MAG: deoxyuridine 5'-triphosphate nucleotidohydrolase [Spirochaetes bacterium GWB1_60_80]OHD35104.1 MAG: deoxyuridine 5'-triphosphate nucleotidohydrolase [Spirochaetes bacterium GWC1_61_12]OHD43622.1 MAG: deoxyuridine 5'-triphosphate nucleotidohydrolase [Spirochaetes bacterium GWD1_61_31]OHD44114.1 MAG: deoxyuridine 5'-triphosphate nucleotidohydrolase [Spirochaetes bacterium GWE1_60_18]OHD61845.1 MAG: deoxyuridine 5'-triphosphate nucleotidohydrolase [Spirochaetes bacterium GWF1_60_12]HAW850